MQDLHTHPTTEFPTDDPAVDPTVHDLDLTGHVPQPPVREPRSSRSTRRHRLVAAAVVVALAAAGVGALVARGGSSSDESAHASAADLAAAPTVGAEANVDQSPEPQPQPQPQGDDGGGDGGAGEPAPPAEPGVLALNTSKLVLMAGDYDGSFTVRNDGGSPLDWEFQPGIAAISVSQSSGTLAPGASTVVSFTIDPFQLPMGAFVFVNHVVSGDSVKSLAIQGEKTTISLDAPIIDLD